MTKNINIFMLFLFFFLKKIKTKQFKFFFGNLWSIAIALNKKTLSPKQNIWRFPPFYRISGAYENGFVNNNLRFTEVKSINKKVFNGELR